LQQAGQQFYLARSRIGQWRARSGVSESARAAAALLPDAQHPQPIPAEASHLAERVSK
jgi:hypothetical protein